MSSEIPSEHLKVAGSALLAGAAAIGAIAVHAEPAAAFTSDNHGKVVVASGDTVSSIIHAETGHTGAQLYEHDVPVVAKVNHLANVNHIYPGEKLDLGTVTPGSAQSASKLERWRIRNVNDTWWAWSEVVAELNGITRQQALAEIYQSNPGINPDTQQVGDSFNLPVEKQRFEDILRAVDHLGRLRSQRAAPDNIGTRPAPVHRPEKLAAIKPEAKPAQQPNLSADSKILSRKILEDTNITIAPSPHDRVRLSIENIEDDGRTFTHDVEYPGEVAVSPKLLQVLEILAKTHHITITSLTTGEHAATSEHYQGRAVDITVDPDLYRQLFINRQAYGIDELIFANPPSGTTTLKHGLPFDYDNGTLSEHASHIHFSLEPAVHTQSPTPDSKVAALNHGLSGELSNVSYDTNTNVLSKSGLSAHQLNEIFAGTDMAGLGQAFIDAENQYGINALFASMHGALESAWGSSRIAQTKHNLFGINAYDSCPQSCATSYEGFVQSIKQYAQFLQQNYLSAGGRYYTGGTTIANVFEHYSTAGRTEAISISHMMNEALQHLGAR